MHASSTYVNQSIRVLYEQPVNVSLQYKELNTFMGY